MHARIVAIRSPHVQGDFRIGAWLIQPQLHSIAGDGRVTRVEPKAMQVLVYLAEHPDQVVPKERLISAVWEDTFVTDDVLTRCISELRKAFDEDAKNPKIIETIPRSGYRLAAPVGLPTPEEIADAAATKPQARALLSRAGIGAAVTFLVLLAVAAVYWTRLSPRAHPPPGRIMLAVLPFQNLSGDPEQEYFSDGLTAEMISQLGRLPPERLGVIARTSAIQYKNTKKSAAEIGRELGADYLVEGSVQRAGERVRIRTELVQVRDQTHVWAESYERNLRDVLTLESEVAEAIAGEIRVNVAPREQTQPARSRSVNPEAYDAYLQGYNHLWNQGWHKQGAETAMSYFRQAIGKDPHLAMAYVGLADSYAILVDNGFDDPTEDYPKVEEATKKALEIDPGLGDAHRAMASVREYYWDWAGAEKEYQLALRFTPSSAHAHHWYSLLLALMGRRTESIAEARRALELSPLEMWMRLVLARAYYRARQYESSAKEIEKVLAVDPQLTPARIDLAATLLQMGRTAEAIAEIEKARSDSPDKTYSEPLLASAYAVAGKKAVAREMLTKMKAASKQKYVPSTDIALVYVGLGEKDQAIRWLEKAMAQRDADLEGLKVEPVWDPLRNDPRFQDILRRVGLP